MSIEVLGEKSLGELGTALRRIEPDRVWVLQAATIENISLVQLWESLMANTPYIHFQGPVFSRLDLDLASMLASQNL